MPAVELKMLAGRSHEVKAKLAERLTQAVAETLEMEPEAISVLITDVPRENWAFGGVLVSDRGGKK